VSGWRALLDVAADLWRFSRESRRLAFLLLALLLLGLGVVIVLGEKSVVMPLVYTLF
jgi:Tfp pilus assembly protein PilN